MSWPITDERIIVAIGFAGLAALAWLFGMFVRFVDDRCNEDYRTPPRSPSVEDRYAKIYNEFIL